MRARWMSSSTTPGFASLSSARRFAASARSMSISSASGNTATVAYTQPAVNFLRDLAGNAVATFAAQTVTNNVV